MIQYENLQTLRVFSKAKEHLNAVFDTKQKQEEMKLIILYPHETAPQLVSSSYYDKGQWWYLHSQAVAPSIFSSQTNTTTVEM